MEQEFDELDRVRVELAKLNAVREMTQSDGWSVVCQHFSEVIRAVQDKLSMEEDLKNIVRLQERLRAFRSMLQAVDAMCSQHAEASARLDDIVTDKNERDQYGLN